jgi:threonine/homoserine efflux transporter RhtA
VPRYPLRTTPEPLDVDAVRVVTAGTVLWAVTGLVLLIGFRPWLQDTGREWWLWTCLVGAGLGVLGVVYCRRRRDRLGKLLAARGD